MQFRLAKVHVDRLMKKTALALTLGGNETTHLRWGGEFIIAHQYSDARYLFGNFVCPVVRLSDCRNGCTSGQPCHYLIGYQSLIGRFSEPKLMALQNLMAIP